MNVLAEIIKDTKGHIWNAFVGVSQGNKKLTAESIEAIDYYKGLSHFVLTKCERDFYLRSTSSECARLRREFTQAWLP